MRAILAAATAAMAFATPAATQGFDASRQIEVFTRDDLKATLTAIDATYSESEGRRNIDIEFASGLVADALMMACDDETSETNCYGTSILATFTPGEGATPESIDTAINTYNYNENFGRAYLDPDGTISLRAYIISDGGISMENYRSQILLFAASAEDFFGYLYGEE